MQVRFFLIAGLGVMIHLAHQHNDWLASGVSVSICINYAIYHYSK